MLRRSTLLFVAASLWAQPVEVVKVRSQQIERMAKLQGELMPYQRVAIHARVTGFIEQMLVDRGSAVKQGQLLAKLSAPEVDAQIAEAESKAQTMQAQKAEAEARLASAQALHDRLKTAAATVGAIAGNELVQAEKAVDAARAHVRSAESAAQASQENVRATKQMQSYLHVTAPFSGVITERFLHPGALVGPQGGSAGALLELEQVSRLRLVVAVPEAEVSGVRRGARIQFRVPAYPQRNFHGVVARTDRSLDSKTRTMSVELDVQNTGGSLFPGMYPEVEWPSRQSAGLLVPPTSVVTTTERTFVVRVASGRAEWIDVTKVGPAGELIQVRGPLQDGDSIVKRATDEIREGDRLQVKLTN